MPGALKHRASTRLAARASPYHSSVTLFEPEDVPGPSTPRPSKRMKAESEVSIDQQDAIHTSAPDRAADLGVASQTDYPTPKGKVTKPRNVKAIPQSLAEPHPEPTNWKEVYDTIKEMRSHIVAPVDTMGCDQAQLKEKDPKSQRFATLISLMLSSQTKDEVTDVAVSKLRSAVGGSLTVDAIREADESIISEAISKVGFWRRKTQYIKLTAQRLCDDFDSDLPKTIDELCSLPGVGPKMAFLALQVAWKLNLGIGVDVHVHRITNRLGWHKPPTKNPEETRLNLQSWLPTELHPDINHMLVGFGQTVCLPVGPRCDLCDLSSSGLCPSAQTVVNAKNRRSPTKRAPSTSSLQAGPKIEIALELEEVLLSQVEDGLTASTSR